MISMIKRKNISRFDFLFYDTNQWSLHIKHTVHKKRLRRLNFGKKRERDEKISTCLRRLFKPEHALRVGSDPSL